MQALQGGRALKSSSLVPCTQRLIPARQTKCTTGVPERRTAQLARSENAAFWLNPSRRVEALKNATGACPGLEGELAATWLARRAIWRRFCQRAMPLSRRLFTNVPHL